FGPDLDNPEATAEEACDRDVAANSIYFARARYVRTWLLGLEIGEPLRPREERAVLLHCGERRSGVALPLRGIHGIEGTIAGFRRGTEISGHLGTRLSGGHEQRSKCE